ncbi:MAG TPA: hypothetical protein VJZ03_05965 [Candidatus Bathyarchaeia archaeon]|nr:hypothetical protein [Candidatus Bathyarchaeia archaeon]
MKHEFVDMSAVLFMIGGVVSLVMNILMIPIVSIYPLVVPTTFSLVFLVVFGLSLVCSLGAIHCYSLTSKRLLSEAAIRGIVFGTLLLILSLGLVGSFRRSDSTTMLTGLSSVLILVAGIICFALRHTNVSTSNIARQRVIAQPAYQV